MDFRPSTRKILWALALLWLALPPLVLSAVVHMADPDVDGWRGLVSPTVIWSVVLGGVVVAGCVVCCVVIFESVGRWGFLTAAGLLAVAAGVALAVLGSGATTTAGRIWTFVGSAAVVFFLVLLVALPVLALTSSGVPFPLGDGSPDTPPSGGGS